LRTRKQRWPATVQLEVHELAAASESFGAELGREIGRPDFQLEVRERSFCFRGYSSGSPSTAPLLAITRA
jgi:hypothetical protein